jgi:hypothetical protein
MADRPQLFWFMTQVQYAVEDFLERPGDDRKANLIGKLVEYQEAVRLGYGELPTMTRHVR